MTPKELEERLINFAVKIILFLDKINPTIAGRNIIGQLSRSGTSPALNYGEAQSAESGKDFVHKLRIVLKELRETNVALKITDRAKMHNDQLLLDFLLIECNELISIFVKSIETSKRTQSKINR
jgi:four helix bundle protein